jgi:squalene-associated FAD-dependent desaturase
MDRALPLAGLSRVHVVGAGLAGLAAAVALARANVPATLYEAAPAAGGRCRSYLDTLLGRRIDNGNHLLLSGNTAVRSYLETTGGLATLSGLPARFPFFEPASGARWALRPAGGRLPWWILCPSRRLPATRARDYLGLLALRRAGPEATVAEVLGHSPLYARLVAPLAVAVLNTPPERGAASLLAAVLRETLFAGAPACRPWLPRVGLSESLVEPALAWLRLRGGRLATSCRVTALRFTAGRLSGLETSGGPVVLGRAEAAVLAVPPWGAAALLPGLPAPDAFEAILNLHFRVALPATAEPFLGLIGGVAEWAFAKDGVLSATVSAAGPLLDQPAATLAARIWPELCAAFGLSGSPPPFRVVKERRATFAATPAVQRLRPPADWPSGSGLAGNLVLAGDWTDTGLPATVEGAIRSGFAAARALLGRG